MEEEPDASANQVLPQIAVLVRVDLGAGVIEIFILDKGAEVRGKEVV